jgi:DNA-binding NarL/FixJ family response regulator
VRTATNSEEALAVFTEIPVDIMLTDIEMPGENGLELNKKVQEKYPDTLRILLTSHAEFSMRRRASSWAVSIISCSLRRMSRSRNAFAEHCIISMSREKGIGSISMASCLKQTRPS